MKSFQLFLLFLFKMSLLNAQTFTDSSHLLNPSDGFVDISLGVSAADFNNDGLVDIYQARLSEPGILYMNNGEEGFSNVMQAAGLDDSAFELFSWGGVWGDYDNDGYLDILFIASNKLYKNNRDGTFSKTSMVGINIPEGDLTQGMGWADFNLDGKLDIFLNEDFGSNKLFKNLNYSVFEDISASSRVSTVGGLLWDVMGRY